MSGGELNRRNFIKALAAATVAPGAFREVLAQQETQETIEEGVNNYFRQFGIEHPENPSPQELTILTDLMLPIVSPLAVYRGQKRKHPNLKTPGSYRKQLVIAEQKIMQSHYRKAQAFISALPTGTTIPKHAWTTFLDARFHLMAIEESLQLFPDFYEQKTSAQKQVLELSLRPVREKIKSLEATEEFQAVKNGNWQETGNSVEKIQLTTEQKTYRDLIVQMIQKFGSEKVRRDLHTILWIAFYESGLNPRNELHGSPYHDSGLFQIIEGTWAYTKTLNPDLNKYPFWQYRFNPEINTLFALTLYANDESRHWNPSRKDWGPKVEKGILFPLH